MDKEKNKIRIIYYDVLNIMAIIAVISLHCNGIVHGDPNIRAWNTSLIVECIFYWAVPIFFMLSGATLMKYREKYDTKTFFRKRIAKILVPFSFWAILMLLWKIKIKAIGINEINSIKDFINIILQNREESTYYFMFEILGIYLTMPLLSLLAREEYKKTLFFTVILYYIFNSLLPNLSTLFGIQYNNSLKVQIGEYIVYVLLGYLLSNEKLEKRQRIIIYILAILGIVFRYMTTFILSKNAGYVVKTTWGYTSWHCIVLACAVFIFIKNLHLEEKLENYKKISNIITKVSSCSFGVYLIHLFVKHYEIRLLGLNEYTWQFRTLGVILTYIISLGIVYILKKIPIVKRIVP